MDPEKKKQFKVNLIKFVIGIILLFISWGYLQKHPAEKVSIFSGFEIIYQKLEILLESSFGNEGEQLKRKYGLQKYYKELIKMAENNKCLDTNTITELETLYHNLKKEKKDSLKNVLPEYTKRAYEFDDIIKNDNC